MPGLPQQPHGFHPAQNLFETLAFPLTHGIARMVGGVRINGTRAPARMLGDMRRHPQLAQFVDEVAGVIALVRPQCRPLLPRNPLSHRLGRLPLGRPRRLRHAGVDHQAVPMLHQHMPQITQLRLLPLAFLNRRASGSVVEACVALVRRSARKSKLGLPGSSESSGGGATCLRLNPSDRLRLRSRSRPP